MKAKPSEQTGSSNPKANVKEITFNVERDEGNGWSTASWDAPRVQGGSTTQGKTFEEALANLKEATELYLSEFPLRPKGRPIMTTFEVSPLAHA